MTLFMLTVMMRSQTSSSIRVTSGVAGAHADVVVEDVDTPGQAGTETCSASAVGFVVGRRL